MPKNPIIPKSDKHFVELLTELKHKIQSARIRACRAANKELIQLYWDIGQTIVQRQEKFDSLTKLDKALVSTLLSELRLL